MKIFKGVPVWSPVLLVLLALGVGFSGPQLFLGAAPSNANAGSTPIAALTVTPAATTTAFDLAQLPSASPSSSSDQPATSAQPNPTLFGSSFAQSQAQLTSAPTATATAVPSPVVPPVAASQAAAPASPQPGARSSNPGSPKPPRIAIQSGHWRAADQPDEFARLRASTGAEGPGWAERDVNLDIAQRVAGLLLAQGHLVEIVPALVPAQYQADVFLALHGDANSVSSRRGFKVARGIRSAIPAIDDALVTAVNRTYGAITAMPWDENGVTNNMRDYYAFDHRYQHSVAPSTPAAILEMGFLSNAEDRAALMGSPDLIAKAIAAALVDFLDHRP